VLLTDIEDSTHLWERHPGDMEFVVNQHDDIVAATVDGLDGRVVKSTGDGSLVLFADPAEAVLAAVEIQRAIATRSWPGIGMLRVRIGIDTGPCRLSRGDVLGRPPNLAARLQAAGHGGQILVSEATAAGCSDRLADDIQLRDLGPYLIRGFDEPVRLHQAVASGLPDRFPPLRALAPGLDDLPAQDFELYGREALLDGLPRLLAEHRLVTLWGPGGVGKTTVAARLARAARRRFDEVWFVDLSSVADLEGAWDAVVAAMHAQPAAGEGPTETVLRCLRPARALLVLDNCEGVLDGARTVVTTVVRSSPTTHVLTTSRQPLGAPGEVPIEIEPLAAPSEHDRSVERLRELPSVQLFVTRLAASRPGFVLDASTADAVFDICRQTDGLPLALDLAAARASTTGLAVDSTMPGRLHASLERSVAVLADDESELLLRLAAFAGPFTRQLAGELAPTPDGAGRQLDRLVHLSIVQRDGADTDRYRLLAPMREFCRERLSAEAWTRTSLAHSLAMVHRAEHLGAELRSDRQPAAVRALGSEFSEYRAALTYLVDAEAFDEAARLVVALFQFCLFQPRPEGQAWARTLAAVIDPGRPLAAEVLGAAALGSWYSADIGAALDFGTRALDAAAAAGGSTTWARTALVNAHGYAGNLDAVVPHYLAFVAEARDSGDPYWQVSGLAYEAISLSMFGRYAASIGRAEEAVRLARELGNSDALHWAFHALGRGLAEEDPIGACEAYEQAMAFAREVGSRFNTGLDLVEWVDVQRRLGELDLARAGADDLLSLLAVSGNRSQVSQALRQAGLVLAATGDAATAALALLARSGLPAMPVGADTQAADAEVLAGLERDLGTAWSRLRVRAMSLSEPALIDLCRSALGSAALGRTAA
jgi:predicted ATPase/class 3 adenylate cyclase